MQLRKDENSKLDVLGREEIKENFDLLIEHSHEGIVVFQDGKIRFSNPKAAKINGFLQEAKTKNFSDFLPHDSLLSMMEELKQSIEEKKFSKKCVKFSDKKGRVKWIGCRGVFIDWKGKPAMLAFLKDFTVQKKAEKKLHASEEKCRQLVENIREAIIVLQKGKIVFANQRTERFAGIFKRLLYYIPFIRLVHPDDKKAAKKCYKKLITAEETSIDWKFRIVDLYGNITWADSKGLSFTWEGKPAILVFLRYLTEQDKSEETIRESEEKYRLLVENTSEAIVVVQDRKVVFGNPKTKELVKSKDGNYLKLLKLLNKQYTVLVHPDDKKFVHKKTQQFKKTSSSWKSPLKMKYRIINPDGEVRWLDNSSVGISWKGRPAALSMIRDITEEKEAEERMKKNLMKFDLRDRQIYLVKESMPLLSREAFHDLLNVNYQGVIISRFQEKSMQNFGENCQLFTLGGLKNKNFLSPDVNAIEKKISSLPHNSCILIERLDYILTKNSFNKILSFIHNLKEHAYMKNFIVILSLDSLTLDEKQFRLLEKECSEIKSKEMYNLPESLLELLRYIYSRNSFGIKPNYTSIESALKLSQKTVRNKVRQLIGNDFISQAEKGREKVLELTDKGISLFRE